MKKIYLKIFCYALRFNDIQQKQPYTVCMQSLYFLVKDRNSSPTADNTERVHGTASQTIYRFCVYACAHLSGLGEVTESMVTWRITASLVTSTEMLPRIAREKLIECKPLCKAHASVPFSPESVTSTGSLDHTQMRRLMHTSVLRFDLL